MYSYDQVIITSNNEVKYNQLSSNQILINKCRKEIMDQEDDFIFKILDSICINEPND